MDITSKIKKLEYVNWKELIIFQSDSFKEWTKEDKERLKESLLKNNFVQPFFLWESDKTYLLDGKHRLDVLHELVADGINVPELLPGIFVECADKKEAAQLVLVYSSIYAKITHTGFAELIKEYDLDFELLKAELSLPEFDMSAFEVMNINPTEETFTKEGKEKPATMKITFSSPEQLEKAKQEIEELLKKYEGSFYSVSAGEI